MDGSRSARSLCAQSATQRAAREREACARLAGAAHAGDVGALRGLLLQAGGEHAHGAARRTALHVAAQAGRLEAVRELLALGADVNARDSLGRTPLHAAVYLRRDGAAARPQTFLPAPVASSAVSYPAHMLGCLVGSDMVGNHLAVCVCTRGARFEVPVRIPARRLQNNSSPLRKVPDGGEFVWAFWRWI